MSHDLLQSLYERVQRAPDALAVRFLIDGEDEVVTLSAGELLTRASSVAAALHERGALGEPVLLLFPPGPEYVIAFYGCLLAGAIAVPLYPPEPWRPELSIQRIRGVTRDSGARLALTTPELQSAIAAFLESVCELPDLEVLAPAPDASPGGCALLERAPQGQPAFLQYTSGSTGDPKGVAVTHANLVHNIACIQSVTARRGARQSVVWLPPYHDMGLIGGILTPVHHGFPTTLMSPLHFLQDPLRWLRAIERYRGDSSAVPTFALALCVRRVSAETAATLDLSSMRLLFNGAEPIDADVMDRFVDRFGPSGFRREAIYPCYGLAEGTLISSGSAPEAALRAVAFDAGELREGRAVVSETGPGTLDKVSCGQAIADSELAIVSPETFEPCAPGEVGEVWLRGPSVAAGYWRRPEATAETFGAHTSEGRGPFLRTGDLGVLVDGELFLVDRLKDLLIIAGKNHASTDLERTATRAHPRLSPGGVCAIAAGALGEPETLALLLEVDSNYVEAEGAAIAAAARAAVTREHGVTPARIEIVPRKSLPRTSSGKLARHACRRLLQQGTLDPMRASG